MLEKSYLKPEEYRTIAKKMIQKIRHPELKRLFLKNEDVIEFVQYYLIKADAEYDESKANGMDLFKFRRQMAIYAIRMKIRELKKQNVNKTISLDQFYKVAGFMKQKRFASPVDEAIDNEERLILEKEFDTILKNNLKKNEIVYIKEFFDGKSAQESATEHDVHICTVRSNIKRGLRKLYNARS